MKYLRTIGALIGALAIFPLAVAEGQDTTAQRDTSSQQASSNQASQDSTQWGLPVDSNPDAQNPQGYRGMERPVNVFPPDSGAEPDRTAGEVEDHVTGTYEDSTWKDTTGAAQNPAGYRGMERPAGLDSAKAGDSITQQKARKKESKSKKDPSKTAAKEDSSAAADTSQKQTGETATERSAPADTAANEETTGTPADSQQSEVPESR